MTPTPPADPSALPRSAAYTKLLVLAAIIGAPVSAAAYGFIRLVDWLQDELFTDLPASLGFDSVPVWWPLPMLAIAGVATAAAIIYLPGTGGHSPADGFKTGGTIEPRELPGALLAALASLCFGVVLGPEAPLIFLGGGLGALAMRLIAKDAGDQATALMGAAGSFAAISSLLGSPLLGAFLLLEAAGLSGPMIPVVLLPGLLCAGIGSLIFIGLDSLTGFGTASLAVSGIPHVGAPTVAEFGYALLIGGLAPLLGLTIHRAAQALQPHVERRRMVTMPLLGLVIAGLAIVFGQVTDKPASEVLFSGENALSGLISGASSWSTGALIALIAAKGIAYSLSLSSFRGGPVFPSMFIGAAGGIALAGLPGLAVVPGVAMGIGAMCTVMLGLPLTSVLLASLLLSSEQAQVMPLVIVAVVVAYVVTKRIEAALEVHPHRVMTATTPPGPLPVTSNPREKADV